MSRVIAIGSSSLFISDGNYSSKYPRKDDFLGSGIPFISANNLRNGKVVWDNMKFISPEQHQSLKKGHLKTGDVLLVTRGSLGTTAYVTKDFEDANINAQLVLLRADGKTIDRRYLYYAVSTDEFFRGVLAHASGTAQPQLPIGALKQIPLRLHEFQVQKKIAAILSAYDDLIENNTRRIQILEEMARRIYEEWFLWFRFPGHENVRMIMSELGLIPDCWKVERFGDIFNIRYGRTLPTTQLKADGKYPVYGAGSIIGRYDDFNVHKPTALITSRGAGSGTVWRTRETAFVTNNSLVIEPSHGSKNWRYFFIELVLKFSPIKTIVGGAAQPQVTIDGLQTVRAIVPQDSVVEKFNQIVEPLSEMIDLLVKKNATLSATRDLLLPKLISGELDVSNFPDYD